MRRSPVTPRGYGVGGAGLVLAAVGFAFGYPELAVVGATGVVALGSAVLYGVWRPTLDVQRVAEPDRVACGEGSNVTLHVHNSSAMLAATMIAEDACGRIGIDGRIVDRAIVPVPVLRLRSGATTDVRYPVPTGRRGVVQVGPLRVTRRDPLGLISLGRDHGGTARIWVHPHIHPLQAIPAGITRSLDGRVDRVPHGSITFDTLREYVMGDELRHVHWRTSAKVGELMVREHLDTSLPRIVVLLDDRAESYPSPSTPDDEIAEFEAACEAAASVVAAAVREDLPIVLHTVCGQAAPGQHHPGGLSPGRGNSSARPHLDALAEAAPHSGTPDAEGFDHRLTDAANRLRQHRPGDTLIYLTGTAGLSDLGLIGALRGPFPAVVTGVFGPISPQDPGTGGSDMLMMRAEDAADFAAEWDGVARW
jgi:uncharacterized protein (DUF58 family)